MPRGIENTLLAAIVEGRLPPGSKLSESRLAEAFGVSRTLIREALTRLETRRIVRVEARRGWFVNTPDAEEANQVYAARRFVEYGFLAKARPFPPAAIARLRTHIEEERAAIAEGDKSTLIYLMGDFHVRIAEASGNRALVELLQTLTARTILISLCYQSERNALASHRDHVEIVDALAAGDMTRAAQLSFDHLEDVEAGLNTDIAPDPLGSLRTTLRLDRAPGEGTKTKRPENPSEPSDQSEKTHLGN
ncbi:GntR family transcriptional regulator [Pseudooceanicola sp. CBS1P-1]|uniref:GntR family transcriptional regulator n=1 Tax=Pseudooceanicola TaxID=1679449 RepID=UPI001928B1E6|nr:MULTISPECIES: GntR family transcriptional regulator [Pseudooceanicola]MBT9382953.1 GntR family transcriptional regulator [Pseudooceanicola endophyticus]